jgi:hypothetical protein
MADEEKVLEQPVEENEVDAIIKMKQNTVPKTEHEELKKTYEELQGKYNQILDAYIEGKEVKEVNAEPQYDLTALQKEYMDTLPEDRTPCENIELMLNIRSATIEKYGVDPFVGAEISEEDAEQVAQALTTALEDSRYNDADFARRMQQFIKDDTTNVAPLSQVSKRKIRR